MGGDISNRDPNLPPGSASRLGPVIERSPLPMVEVHGPRHHVRAVNSAFCALLGKRREELLGVPFDSLVHNGEKCAELLDRVYKTGAAATLTEPAGTGEDPAYWLYAMWPALDETEKPERVVVQLTKTTGFQQNTTAVNEALLLGALRQHELREAAEKSNAQLHEEVAERRRAEAALHAAKEQLRVNAEELEQTVAERTAQLQSTISELNALSYTLAHDLRAPIRAIHGFVHLVLEMPPDQVNPAAAELLRRVVAASVRMDSLIQDVLSLNHVLPHPVTLSRVDVDDLVRRLVAERPELLPPWAHTVVESPLLSVLGHEQALRQCLAHLLSNAVKFVEPGALPRIRVWTELSTAADQPGGFVASRGSRSPFGPKVRIWVEDEGIGIPADAQTRIFEIFQRLHDGTAYSGSGIGLAIVRKAVEAMGGRAGVISEPEKGSRFWLELPKA